MKKATVKMGWMTAGLLGMVCSFPAFGLSSDAEKTSYSLGVDIGRNLKAQNIPVETDAFSLGVKEGAAGNLQAMNETEVKNTLTKFQEDLTKKREAELKKMAETNKTEGEAFLKENAKKEGVVTLPSGLQYKIIAEGTGTPPKLKDTVTTQYRGRLINGTEFDSSYSRNEPAQFQLDALIPGWLEALQLMKPGSKWELVVPAKLAYGERGAGNIIGPNATLIFEIELLKVEPNATSGKAAQQSSKTGKKS